MIRVVSFFEQVWSLSIGLDFLELFISLEKLLRQREEVVSDLDTLVRVKVLHLISGMLFLVLSGDNLFPKTQISIGLKLLSFDSRLHSLF